MRDHPFDVHCGGDDNLSRVKMPDAMMCSLMIGCSPVFAFLAFKSDRYISRMIVAVEFTCIVKHIE